MGYYFNHSPCAMRLTLLLVCGFLGLSQAALKKEDDRSNQREKIFYLASTLTTTFMSVSTLTSVVPYSCFTAPVTNAACAGKKKKKRSLINFSEDRLERDLSLDTSLSNIEKKVDADDKSSSKSSGKFNFTLWSTTTTFKTLTSFSTNRDITVSIRSLCTIANVFVGDAPLC